MSQDTIKQFTKKEVCQILVINSRQLNYKLKTNYNEIIGLFPRYKKTDKIITQKMFFWLALVLYEMEENILFANLKSVIPGFQSSEYDNLKKAFGIKENSSIF